MDCEKPLVNENFRRQLVPHAPGGPTQTVEVPIDLLDTSKTIFRKIFVPALGIHGITYMYNALGEKIGSLLLEKDTKKCKIMQPLRPPPPDPSALVPL